MRRALALALVAGVAYAGWRYWLAGGLGGAPGAGASLGALDAYAPSELRAELDHERAAATLGGLRDDGWSLGDPTNGSRVLAQIPNTQLAAQVAAIATAGRATLEGGIRTNGRTTQADRRVLAEGECRRAANVAGMPAWLIGDCTRSLTLENVWRYQPTGARVAAVLDIGAGGLTATTLPADWTPTLDPVTGRPRPPTA